jgi:transposase
MTMTVLDRALTAGDAGQVTGDQERPDPEVPEKGRRRTFTAQYKQEVLAAYEAAPGGEKGAIQRREGLYSSLISEWRRARDAGALAGLKQPRGRSGQFPPPAAPRPSRGRPA